MTNLFRKLCAELLDKWDSALGMDDLCDMADVMDRLRAALSEPVVGPAAPSDEELLGVDELRDAWNAQADAANSWDELGMDEMLCFAQQQALARWGRPAVAAGAATRPALVRYGVCWEGIPSNQLLVPMDDGYWTPWHLAAAAPAEHGSTAAAPEVKS